MISKVPKIGLHDHNFMTKLTERTRYWYSLSYHTDSAICRARSTTGLPHRIKDSRADKTISISPGRDSLGLCQPLLLLLVLNFL